MVASQMHPTPAQPDTRQRVGAWIAFVLALIYPLTVAFYAVTIQTRNLSGEGNIVVESLYNVLTYFEWPLPIFAIFLASLVLSGKRGPRRIAWAAVILGALSLLAIAGVIVALAFFAHGQSASSS